MARRKNVMLSDAEIGQLANYASAEALRHQEGKRYYSAVEALNMSAKLNRLLGRNETADRQALLAEKLIDFAKAA